MKNILNRRGYIITGPTLGIGRATALEMASYGTLILVGRDRARLEEVQNAIEQNGGQAVPIVCDLSEIESVLRAVRAITALDIPIAGLLNNAGIFPRQAGQNSQGWNLAFVTNHLGPFVLTEALLPHLMDGANVVFVVSAMEDPERKPAKAVGMKGGRYISAEACARGEWAPGGSTLPGADAYATTKQCGLATALAFARETPRLRFNAVEPGITPGTGLGRDANAFARFLFSRVLTLLPPFREFRSTPKRAARVITKILTAEPGSTGVYYDQHGLPMLGSEQVCSPKFQNRVVAETRRFIRETLGIEDYGSLDEIRHTVSK